MVTAVSGTVFIAAGAFWLSFTALADLAARSGVGAGQAWAWPLIVDGIIVVATVAVVALAGQKTAWYPWVLLIGGAAVSVTANAIHAVVAADADVPGVLAASVAAVPPVVLLAITHLTVILTRPAPGTAGPDEASPGLATPSRAVRDAPEPSQPRELTAPRRADDFAHGAGANVPDTSTATAALERRNRAAELRRVGWSNKRIARELGVHPSTVGRWFAGAHLPDSNDGEEATR
ncbi:helix-turn-helix domain-containing protein [Brachybacterium sacelli]|uniref:helix-turn-helix domain-containing protein n=1 Tax=Brachybacterium sacelli TaxID=173364 RepID=UPI00315AB15B